MEIQFEICKNDFYSKVSMIKTDMSRLLEFEKKIVLVIFSNVKTRMFDRDSKPVSKSNSTINFSEMDLFVWM